MIIRFLENKITKVLHHFEYPVKLGVLHQHEPISTDLKKYSNYKKKFSKSHNYPKISIVTPSYNQGRFIKNTIDSVLDQKYSNLEYYIQDGCSSDETLNILKKYSNTKVAYVSEPDAGQADAINKGFEKTSGDIMAWLNSDDLLMPGTLHFVADFFQKNPNVDVLYGNRLLIDENNKKIGQWVLPGHDSNLLSYCDFIPQETLFWRRSLWDKIGGKLDETYMFAMDWDLLVRMKLAGGCFKHIPRFLGVFRVHKQQKTSAQLNDIGAQEMQKILQKLHSYIPDYQIINQKLEPFLRKHVYADFMHTLRASFLRPKKY